MELESSVQYETAPVGPPPAPTSLPELGSEEQTSCWRVLLVEDHPVVRRGLASLMQEQEDMKVCGEADNAYDAIRQVAALNPDICIVDISLNGADGLELTKDLKSRHPSVPVLVLSVFDEYIYAERALRAGASGYLMKSESATNLINAIRRVLTGDIYLSDRSASKILAGLVGSKHREDQHSIDELTDRELQVFRSIGKGMNTSEIADSLLISVKTVEAHREHIKRKLNLKRSSELLRFAIQHSLQQ
jgi:DNA-binding NarL/FixJ family response regulator